MARDYLCLKNKSLVGYVGGFYLEKNLITLSMLNSPDFPKESILTNLLSNFMTDHFSFHSSYCIVVNKTHFLSDLILGLKNIKIFKKDSIYFYNRGLEKSIKSTTNFHLRKCNPHDDKLLATINALAFSEKEKFSLYKMKKYLASNKTKMWLIYQKDEVLGNINVRWQAGSFVIHDFGILPKHQGKSYGKKALSLLISNTLPKNSYISVRLDSNNAKLINFYRSSGFYFSEQYYTILTSLQMLHKALSQLML